MLATLSLAAVGTCYMHTNALGGSVVFQAFDRQGESRLDIGKNHCGGEKHSNGVNYIRLERIKWDSGNS